MKRLILLSSILLAIFVLAPDIVSASILVVKKDGNLEWKVLSSEDSMVLGIPKRDSLVIKSLTANQLPDSNVKIALTRTNGKSELNVSSALGENSLDITQITGDVVEIEERPQVSAVKIGVSADKFIISQGNLLAQTEFPININSKSADLTVKTQSGERLLAILPREALTALLRAKTISKIKGNMVLNEGDKGELAYAINGVKTVNLFNLYNLDVAVESRVSATTGEILSIDEPKWLKVLGFLFS